MGKEGTFGSEADALCGASDIARRRLCPAHRIDLPCRRPCRTLYIYIYIRREFSQLIFDTIACFVFLCSVTRKTSIAI